MGMMMNQSGLGEWPPGAAILALAAAAVSCGALILLHGLSAEFSPSWRMVSEYANGRFAWLLTLVFFAWAVSYVALGIALLPLWATTLGKIGLIFLLLAAVGQAMGGLFDINHSLHGPAAMIGIPSLCIAAVIVTMALARRADIVAPPMWSGHLPWVAFVLMLGAFALFFLSLKNAGVDMSGQSTPMNELPDGVVGYVGWANRLVFAASYLWVTLTALAVISAGDRTA
jgi:hypothetical protein